jgi:hypothetical protein
MVVFFAPYWKSQVYSWRNEFEWAASHYAASAHGLMRASTVRFEVV